MVAERGLGGFSGLGGLAGKSEDDLIDEFGARQPVQIGNPPQDRWRQRKFVIHKTTDGCAAQRIITQSLSDRTSDRPPADNEDLARLGFAAAPPPYHLPQAAQQRKPGQGAG